MTHTALAALLSIASMAGIEPAFIEVPAIQGETTQTAPKEIMRLSFDEIQRDQERAWVYREVGRGRIGFMAALDPEAALWVKLRQGRRTRAHTLDELAEGVRDHFPVESYHFLYGNGILRAFPAAQPQYPQANIPVSGLVQRLYKVSLHLLFSPVEYAVVVEEDGPAPESVSLIRQARDGSLWVTHKSLDELDEVHWFVAINGIMYGMNRQGRELVFFSKPTTAVNTLVLSRERSIL